MSERVRIGILSDTHGLLRPEVAEALRGCSAILHGGDVDRQEILDRLGQIAPVYAVRGNNDGAWAEQLPETLEVTLGGLTFVMIHDRKQLTQDTGSADVVVYGHSHRYEEICEGSRLWLNPGSCGPGRFFQPVTMAMLETGENGVCRVERLDLPRKGGEIRRCATVRRRTAASAWETAEAGQETEEAPAEDAGKIPANIQDLIPRVIKDMNRGRPIAEIAARTGLSYELTEQICRLYATHPGVDLEGILRRMGI